MAFVSRYGSIVVPQVQQPIGVLVPVAVPRFTNEDLLINAQQQTAPSSVPLENPYPIPQAQNPGPSYPAAMQRNVPRAQQQAQQIMGYTV